MEPRDYEIELLKQRLENLEGQVKRHTSHFESERDHVREHGQNINLLLRKADKMESTIYENGKGLVQRVGILEHEKKQSRHNAAFVISVLSLLVALAAVLVMIFK